MNTDRLAADLKDIFGERLKMVAAYGPNAHTCAIIDSLTINDLERCASLDAKWKDAGLDTPLFLVATELTRAIDAFPLEFSEIIATRRVITGTDLFDGLTVEKSDLRRACEVQARGHVVHLREGFIEAAGDAKAIDRLVAAAILPFRGLVASAARLDGISPKALVTRLELDNFEKAFPEALRAAERLVEYVDRWSH
jgi:hypothetical protein